MRQLAKIGFTQSYTYFTWKNSRWELSEYVNELAHGPEREYFRPNFFINTPDILHAYLQHGGPPAFASRLVLAGTLSPTYGIYSGYEWFENVPVREGSEEYLNSEKYEIRERALDGPLLPMVRRINEIRRENPALQRLENVTFIDSYNEALIAYVKSSPGNTVICVVNIDEEYLDSEKYETKQRALDGPLLPMVRRINEIRRENPALQRLENVTFLETYNEALIAYVKSVPGNTVVCVVNIDPTTPRRAPA